MHKQHYLLTKGLALDFALTITDIPDHEFQDVSNIEHNNQILGLFEDSNDRDYLSPVACMGIVATTPFDFQSP